VEVWDRAGNTAADTSDAAFTLTTTATGIPEGPGGFTTPVLLQNHPNPFSASTHFAFYLPQAAPVVLRVYDLSGRLVQTLFSGEGSPGLHEVEWGGRTQGGRTVGAGIYFMVLDTPDGRRTRKLIRTR